MARRKNASFTGADGSRELVEKFYNTINRYILDDTPVPIPPPALVHPTHDVQTQAYIFADYAVRVFTPIALDAAGVKAEASKLRQLKKIVDNKTANEAENAALAVVKATKNKPFEKRINKAAVYAAVVADAGGAAARVCYAAAYAYAAAAAAKAVCHAAELNPDETWAAVNEMLDEL